MPILQHFTSVNALRPIAEHGVTIGDIPTDLHGNKGICGVWLTDAQQPNDLGLAGSRLDKSACRLRVAIPDGSPLLHRWADWASHHVTQYTISTLAETAGAGANPDSWYIYLGWVRPEWVISVEDTRTDTVIANWETVMTRDASVDAVRFRDRHRWHKRLLQKFAQHQRQMSSLSFLQAFDLKNLPGQPISRRELSSEAKALLKDID